MMMSCGTGEPSVCALLNSLMRNETSVLEEEEKSVKGQSLREYCQGIRANNACILSQMTQTASCTSERMGTRKTEFMAYTSLFKTCILGLVAA